MKKYLKEFSNYILSLNRYSKRAIAIITDVSLIVFCTWLAFILRLEELILLKDFNFLPVILSILVVIPIFWLFGLYEQFFDIQVHQLFSQYQCQHFHMVNIFFNNWSLWHSRSS